MIDSQEGELMNGGALSVGPGFYVGREGSGVFLSRRLSCPALSLPFTLAAALSHVLLQQKFAHPWNHFLCCLQIV